MKTIHQIFIIIFIAASLLIVKDDVVKVYNRGVTYLSEKVITVLNKEEAQSVINNEIEEDGILKLAETTAETPGALKVPDNFLNINKVNLSRESVIAITNKERLNNGGLLALKENEKLNLSAMKKVEDMFAQQYFEHLSPDRVGVSDLADQVSYEYITVGENLAMGNFKSDQALVDAWMASPGHRANILNGHYAEIGVAVREGLFEGRKVWLAVQHFGIPKDVCPEVDQTLRGIISVEEKQAESMGEDLALRLKKIGDRVVYEEMSTNEQIDKYNSLVIVYNQLISELKEKINNYNKQVKIFNSCLEENTTESTE